MMSQPCSPIRAHSGTVPMSLADSILSQPFAAECDADSRTPRVIGVTGSYRSWTPRGRSPEHSNNRCGDARSPSPWASYEAAHSGPPSMFAPVFTPSVARPTPDHAESGVELACELSLGTVGHPSSCGPACKYVVKRRGCKDGRQCSHCHLCTWKKAGNLTKSEHVDSYESRASDASPSRATSSLGGSSLGRGCGSFRQSSAGFRTTDEE